MPVVGNAFGKLGIRLRDPSDPRRGFDLDVTDWDAPVPAGQGLSCSRAAPADLLRMFKKPLRKTEYLWEIDENALPAGLSLLPNAIHGHPEHMLVVPVFAMSCRAFLALILETRSAWCRVE